MEKNISSYRSTLKTGLVFGILLILIGLLFIGINFGFLSANVSRVVISWPMLLIVIGIFKLFRLKFFSACLFLLVGGFFMIPLLSEFYPNYFYWVTASFVAVCWPILLIGAGVLLVLHRFFSPKSKWSRFYMSDNYAHYYHRGHRKRTGTGGFEKNAVFGDGEHIILDPVFTGGEANAVFGGIALDLRKTTLPEGETYLEINAVFGGVVIIVPENWFIEFQTDAVFGGFRDNRVQVSGANIDKSRKLVIGGSCVFGGGELKN